MWKKMRFDELFKVGSAKRVLKSQWKEKGVPFYRGREVTKLSMNGSVDNQLFITKTHFEELKEKHGVPNVDDIIITAIGTIGNAYIVKDNDEFYFKDASVLWLNKKSDIISKYVDYFIKSDLFKSQLDNGNGATVDSLTIKKLASIEIHVPQLQEQQLIVSKLNSAFTELDKLKMSEEIKLKKNETLIQNFLDKIFMDNKNLHKLSDCTQINPPKSEVNDLDDATEVAFMPMKDMGINNKLAIPNQERKLKDVRGSYTYFSEGDILLAKITPCFENGKMGIAFNLLNGIGFGSSEYIIFRPNKNLKNEWLYYFLNRNSFRINGARNMSGAVGHKRVIKNFIQNTLIPIPSLEEQEKILFTLKSLSNHSEAINKIILKKKDEINHLKKSILNRLLNNKLVDAA